jgi:threonine dehydratase
MAGNGTIGLELLEDLPEPDVVLVPFGGGGLSAGIARAV